MGEPLHNLDAVLSAGDIMTDPLGLQLSHNKVLPCMTSLSHCCDRLIQDKRSGPACWCAGLPHAV